MKILTKKCILAVATCIGIVAIPIALMTVPMLSGCTTNSQRVAYNSLYTLEKATTAAYDNFIDLVIAHKVPTNDVPKVSQSFNTFQASMQVALQAARYDWTAPPPPAVSEAAAQLRTNIDAAKLK